jgi:hypothetical protein
MADANEPNIDIELRFIKLAFSSLLKTVEALSDDVDVHQTIRNHMLIICEGVRQRALESGGEGATANVDELIKTINEYFDYSQSPMFPPIELVRR